jgi:hypothetical protein
VVFFEIRQGDPNNHLFSRQGRFKPALLMGISVYALVSLGLCFCGRMFFLKDWRKKVFTDDGDAAQA